MPVAVNSELPVTCPGVLMRLERMSETYCSFDSLYRELCDALCKFTSW